MRYGCGLGYDATSVGLTMANISVKDIYRYKKQRGVNLGEVIAKHAPMTYILDVYRILVCVGEVDYPTTIQKHPWVQ